MIKNGVLEQSVITGGMAEGARRLVNRFSVEPSVPPLYGNRDNTPRHVNPQRWQPNASAPVGGPGRVLGPGAPGPGGPGGGRPGGGPGGGGNAAVTGNQGGNLAWFQRGEWDAMRGVFHPSFHHGAAPGGQDMKLAKPPEYDGTQRGESAQIWVQQVERHFILQPHLYQTDQRGIAWATRYLQGPAYK